MVVVTETWLSTLIPTGAVDLRDYSFCRSDRDGRGGGVGIYIRSCLNHNICDFDFHEIPMDTLEHIWVNVNIGGKKFVIGVLYRPPSSNVKAFLSYLDAILPYLVTNFDNIVILGDLNVNLLNENNRISPIFNTYGFNQIIREPTRITINSSSLLDPIFIKSSFKVALSGALNCDVLSDHHLVYAKINIPRIKNISKTVTFRNFKQFNEDQFRADLDKNFWNNIFYISDIDEKIQFLTENIIALFDKHAPITQVRVSKPPAPWLTDTLKVILKLRDEAFLRFKKCKTLNAWNHYIYTNA